MLGSVLVSLLNKSERIWGDERRHFLRRSTHVNSSRLRYVTWTYADIYVA